MNELNEKMVRQSKCLPKIKLRKKKEPKKNNNRKIFSNDPIHTVYR